MDDIKGQAAKWYRALLNRQKVLKLAYRLLPLAVLGVCVVVLFLLLPVSKGSLERAVLRVPIVPVYLGTGAVLVQVIVLFWVAALIQRRAVAVERLAKLQAKIAELSQDHPELALMLDVLRDDSAIQQSKSGRSAFWGGVLLNALFFALGVVTPILLTHLGIH